MSRIAAFKVGFFGVAMCIVSNAASADATFQTLYAFTGGNDGGSPQSGLIMDAAGNLYGTTPLGGASSMGTLFKLAPDGTFILLHTFKGGRDGATPTGAALTLDGHGTIYGLTQAGGVANGGTAYRYRNGKLKILHSFGVGNDVAWPQSGLLMQPDGSLVGVTSYGGGSACTSGCGAIFKLAADGTETILHAFAGGTGDGSYPTGTPVRDLAGNLYGTTYYGGQANKGTVYRIAPDNTASVVYSFANPASNPYQGLTFDKHGNLFGTTAEMYGSFTGAVFEINTSNQESIVFNLAQGPGWGFGLTSLLPDGKGNLYGTVRDGGGNQACNIGTGCGAVVALDPRGQQITVLHAFGGSDGMTPYSGVVADGHGNFYGTTMAGGANNAGTIFKISTGTK